MCIDNKMCFGIANGQILSIFIELSARDTIMSRYYHFMFLFFKDLYLLNAQMDLIHTLHLGL